MDNEEIKIDKGGHRVGKPRNAKERNLIKAGVIFDRVVKHANGECEMTATQLRAAEIVLSKTMPSLQNVEQQIINDNDTKSIDQLKAELLALVQANPELLTELNSVVNTQARSDVRLTDITNLESRH